MPLRSRLCALALAFAVAPGCATTGSGDDLGCEDIIGITVFTIFAIPCGIAAGVGCISGGATRCGEGPPQSDVPPPPPTAVESDPAPAAASPAMEF